MSTHSSAAVPMAIADGYDRLISFKLSFKVSKGNY